MQQNCDFSFMALHVIDTPCAPLNDQNGGKLNEPLLSKWGKQHGLNDNVMIALKKNEINSLQDLEMLENDQDIKEFVNELSIKPFIMKKKLTKAIKSLQSKEEQDEKQQQQS